MSEFTDFMAAISGQESGGNYGAINSRTGASGRYQIMPANIGPWSQKYLGRTVSVAQFRSDPGLQDQLATAVLQSYYNQHGLRGAAAAWYSGNPGSQNNYKKFRSNEPSVGEYVDKVLGRMGTARSTINSAAAPALAPEVVGTTVKRGKVSPLGAAVQQADLYQTMDPKEVIGKAIGLAGVGNGLELGLGAADGQQAVGSSIGETTKTETQYRMPVPKAGTTTTTTPAGASGGGTGNALRSGAVAKAMSFQGVPYVWGGTSPSGFDCSGLTQFALRSVGINIPRVSQAQDDIGPRIPLANAQPGDLIGFADGGHIAMYIGNGMMVEAPRPGLTVRSTQVRGAFAVDMSSYYKG